MSERYVLLYDGACQLCARAIRMVRRLDRAGAIEPVPYQRAGAVSARHGISESALREEMHLISPAGERWSGAPAAAEILRITGHAISAALLRLPVLRWLARLGYRAIARHRHQLGCATPDCELPTSPPLSRTETASAKDGARK